MLKCYLLNIILIVKLVNLVLLENLLIFHLKTKKLNDNLIKIGQSSLPILNRLGTHMYWNNVWLNNFNTRHFLNKTLFFENIFFFIFSEKIFKFFFSKIFTKFQNQNFQFKSFFIKKNKKKKFTFLKKNVVSLTAKKKINYNFTRIWFVKYNNYILFTSFVFFYFKIKKKKPLKGFFKNQIILKPISLFLQKNRGKNFKRRVFLNNNYLVF